MPSRQRDRCDPTVTVGLLRAELRKQQREIQRLRVENEILRDAASNRSLHAAA